MISLVMEATTETVWPISWAESHGLCAVRWGWFHNGAARVRVGVERVCDSLAVVHGPDVETLELLWLQTKGARALMVAEAARKRPDWPTVDVQADDLEAEPSTERAPVPAVSGAMVLTALEEDQVKGKLVSLSKDINKPLEVWDDGKST